MNPRVLLLLTFVLFSATGLAQEEGNAVDATAGMSLEQKIAAKKAEAENDSTKKQTGPVASEYEMALAQFRLGYNLEQARDYDGALAAYDTSLQIDPNLIEAYIGRGGIKFQKIDFPSAMEDYNRAIEISEKMVEMHEYRANIKTVLADYEGAKVERNKVMGLKDQLAEAYFRRGHLKRFMDDIGGGCEDIEKAKNMGNTRAKTDFQDLCK